jgi:hypothetical protein
MDEYLKKLIIEFPGKDFKDFVGYVYSSFEKQINLKKKKLDKDKYIKIRKSILTYIVSNEKLISLQLNKSKK